jgi:hypothetical protein
MISTPSFFLFIAVFYTVDNIPVVLLQSGTLALEVFELHALFLHSLRVILPFEAATIFETLLSSATPRYSRYESNGLASHSTQLKGLLSRLKLDMKFHAFK